MQKFGLNQTLTQTIKLSPTQIQVIKMLELPSIELSKRINEELQENPALEEGRLDENYTDDFNEYTDEYGDSFDGEDSSNPLQNEDFNYEQYVSDDETPSYMLNPHNSPIDQDRREVPIIGGSSLIEELKSQIEHIINDINK
jgi:RNA polymerase sigma-54 factor